MDIRVLSEVMGKLDATNQSSEAAIADFILATLKTICGLRWDNSKHKACPVCEPVKENT